MNTMRFAGVLAALLSGSLPSACTRPKTDLRAPPTVPGSVKILGGATTLNTVMEPVNKCSSDPNPVLVVRIFLPQQPFDLPNVTRTVKVRDVSSDEQAADAHPKKGADRQIFRSDA